MTRPDPRRPDPQRIADRVAHLAALIDPQQPPYTRRAFTPVFAQGRAWLAETFAAAGLDTGVDAGGNLVGRWAGSEAQLAPIAMGSHSDTVPGGGRYDGIAGVLTALEVAEVLAQRGERLRHPLWVLDFLAEEATDYAVSCVGSRAIAGTLGDDLLAAMAADGETLADGLRRTGGDPEQVRRGPIYGTRPFAAFLELHIEQGPVLEAEGLPVGVVSGVVGIRRYRLTVGGQADHAGTTPMPRRRDALVGAALIVAEVHQRALAAYPTTGLVATVGRIEVRPNAVNVVPAEAVLQLEVRCGDGASLAEFCAALLPDMQRALEAAQLELTAELVAESLPVDFHPQVQGALAEGAEALGLAWKGLPSGAGHDAMHIALLCPTGMVFVPCRAGRSHASEEYADPAALAAGAEVMLEAVLRLDRSLD